MKDLGSGAWASVALFAAAMAFVCVLFIPYGYPWLGFAWAVPACAAAVWVVKSSSRPTRQKSDVISDVERESPRAAAAPGTGVVSTRAFS
jgi:hypothetical protein